MSNIEIERFLSGLHYAENPWVEREYEVEQPPASWTQRLGLHTVAIGLGLVLGTVVWQAVVYVTVANVVMAAAQVR